MTRTTATVATPMMKKKNRCLRAWVRDTTFCASWCLTQQEARRNSARILEPMTTSSHHCSVRAIFLRYTLAAGLLLTPTVVLLHGAPAAAQKAAAARTLDGTVSSKGGPVKGAVVHLKDTRSLAQKSFITAADGVYHFAQLSSGTDYEVWAEADGKKSSVKNISSFDTKNSFNIGLKVD